MTDDNPIRFGILGCAEIARKVSRAINLAPNSTLYAIASRSITKAKNFVLRDNLSNKIKLYGSYEDLLDDPCVDAVYLPLPTTLHLKWAVLAAQKKKHLLLEKPVALNVGELDEILKACEENGVQFMDGSMWYHHPRTAQMKEFLQNGQLCGQIRNIHSSSSFIGPPQFLENDIRVKPDLDALGALGDTGWYCIGAILWAMDQKLPTVVKALPEIKRNSAGVILSSSVSLYWEKEGTIATFYSSFLANETMDLAVTASNGTLHIEDFIIPYEEDSAAFRITSGVEFVGLQTGWSVKPQEVSVDLQLPQEALMIQEFARLVYSIESSGSKPDTKWPQTSRMTQLVLDAIINSIELGFKPVEMK